MKNPPENSQEQEDSNLEDYKEEVGKLERLADRIGRWATILGKLIAAAYTIFALFKSTKKP
jgi:hypothetical protein